LWRSVECHHLTISRIALNRFSHRRDAERTEINPGHVNYFVLWNS
jgi:hypothetical protein